jgi:2-dehydro-3-deoxyphosphogluconate aldolase/(4S)-4-hydroxy-2-oxoglutarate aldolase
MRNQTIDRTMNQKLIAIVRRVDKKSILRLAEALADGGIGMMEVTFNQSDPESFSDTVQSIATIREKLDGIVLPGAGTVMSVEQVLMAAEAGAEYIISPSADRAVIEKTREIGLVSIPGCMTPGEAADAQRYGADFVKLFPAGNLGAGYLRALRSPLSHIRFLAVGGIDEMNAAEFIAAGAVGLGVGGNLINKEWMNSGRFDKITELASRYAAAVNV